MEELKKLKKWVGSDSGASRMIYGLAVILVVLSIFSPSTGASKPPKPNPSSLKPTPTSIPQKTSTPKQNDSGNELYKIYEPDSSFPSCNQFGTELAIGKQAGIVWEMINIRKEPFVPENPSSNVVATLKTGDMVQVIDGVACAYGGYWWKIKTESGVTGWAREKSKEGEVYVWPID